MDCSLADHYTGAECGLSGRHALHGALLGWGRGDGPTQVQEWALDHPLLPLLAPALDRESWPTLGALRMFFGSQDGQSAAEVKLNGTPLEHAARLLLEQDWPRFKEPAFVRAFVLLIPEV